MIQPTQEAIFVPGAWHSGAPYSPAVRLGPWVFLSGMLSVDLADGSTVGGDIRVQTTRVLANLEAVLREAGGSLGNVLKTTVFVTEPGLIGGMNEVYAAVFSPPRPARSTVQVGPLARPEFLLEIEAVAWIQR